MSAKIDNGGPAFPMQASELSGSCYADPGMSLRDWFAGQVLAGGLIRDNYSEYQLKKWFGERYGLPREEIVSRAAYELADALLAERARTEGRAP